MKRQGGYVLIIVLMVLAIATAAVVDFIRTTYVYVNTADNFKESERMGAVLRSAYLFTAEKTKEYISQLDFTDRKEVPFEENIQNINIKAVLTDNNSKFNVNSLVYKNGLVNETGYNIFKRLLREIKLNEDYADQLVDWIDPDKISRSSAGENNAKNYFLFSLSELGYIFSKEDLKTLLPYVTVCGHGKINMNTAEHPVLRALHPEITETTAKRIIEMREQNPFKSTGDVLKVPGMGKIGIEISENITVKSLSFNIILSAAEGELMETATGDFEIKDGGVITRYWKEQ